MPTASTVVIVEPTTRRTSRVLGGRMIPPVLLAVLIFWVAIIFLSFGLFAPRNATVLVALLVCALSVSGSIFLLLELNGPLDGAIRISSSSMRDALAHLDR